MTLKLDKDFTPGGTKIVGQWENDRNAASRQVVHDVFTHLYGKDVQTIIAHHLCYQIQDGDYFIVEEIPSMDALLFDHEIGQKLWGDDATSIFCALAMRPADERDELFAKFFYQRYPKGE